MDAILNFSNIAYPYSSLIDQRRATALAILIRLAIGLAIVIVGVLLVTWTGTRSNTALAVMAPALVGAAALALYFGNRGQLQLASWVFVSVAGLAALVLLGIEGLNSTGALALAIPFFVGGLVLDRRGLVLLTLGLMFGLVIVGVVEAADVGLSGAELVRMMLPLMLLLPFFGAAEWVLLRQIQDGYTLVTRMERTLNGSYELSDIISEADNAENLLREFAIRTQRAMDLHQVQIFLIDDNSPGVLRLRAAAGAAAQRALLDERAISLAAEQLVTMAAKQRETLVARSTDLASFRTGFFPGTQAELALPLLDGDRLLGVIDLQSAFEDAFDLQTIEASVLSSRQMALSLRNLRLTHHLGEAGADQAQLQRHIAQLSSEVQRLRRETSSTVWEDFFRSPDAGSLGFDFTRNDVEPRAGQDVTPAMTEAMQSAEVQIEPTEQGHRLTIPIVMRGEVLGAMEFAIQRGGVLPERLVELATAVSERLSLSLDNARLVEQTQAVAYREQMVSNISGRLQGTSSMEQLITLAAAEFSEAMNGALTHIRMQPRDAQAPQAAPAASSNGGGNA